MNHNELKLARKLLNLTESEAATYLGEGMNVKTWGFYERNHISNYGVKHYIAEKVRFLLRYRKEIIDNALSAREEGSKTIIVHYNEPERFEDMLEYKAHNAATTTLNVDYGFDLIVFNKEEYETFLSVNGLEDNQQNVSHWAIEKYVGIQSLKKELQELEKALEEMKDLLMIYCKEVGFTHAESFKFINLLTTVSQKAKDRFEDRLAEFMAKMLPHTLYTPDNVKLKADFTAQIKKYLEMLRAWAIHYHKTKGVIESLKF